MQLIVIAGQARVGKTTLAHLIAKKAFDMGLVPKLLSFAGPLKEMAKERGYSKEDNPEEYRKFCQDYGASKREEDPDYWIDEFDKEIQIVKDEEYEDLESGKKYWERCVVVDDCRYPNEVDYGISQEGFLIFLSYGKRRMDDPKGDWRNHHSESMARLVDSGASPFRELFSCFIKNQGTLEEFEEKLEGMIPIWCGGDGPSGDRALSDEQYLDLNQAVSDLIDLLLLNDIEEEIDDEEDPDESDP